METKKEQISSEDFKKLAKTWGRIILLEARKMLSILLNVEKFLDKLAMLIYIFLLITMLWAIFSMIIAIANENLFKALYNLIVIFLYKKYVLDKFYWYLSALSQS